jgi:hypothetical protein
MKVTIYGWSIRRVAPYPEDPAWAFVVSMLAGLDGQECV